MKKKKYITLKCPKCKWKFICEEDTLKYSSFEKKYWKHCPNEKCINQWNRVYV